MRKHLNKLALALGMATLAGAPVATLHSTGAEATPASASQQASDKQIHKIKQVKPQAEARKVKSGAAVTMARGGQMDRNQRQKRKAWRQCPWTRRGRK